MKNVAKSLNLYRPSWEIDLYPLMLTSFGDWPRTAGGSGLELVLGLSF